MSLAYPTRDAVDQTDELKLVIELHASFLELNLLAQIRALPNPTYSAGQPEHMHPLTLHLSPTSTANIVVTSLSPPPPSSSPFAKISPDAEVIVAPKVRSKHARSSSKRSVGARSNGSTRHKGRSYSNSRGSIYLRGVDRQWVAEWFDDQIDDDKNEGFRVWVDPDLLATNELRGAGWVCVTVLQPSGLKLPPDPQQQQNQAEQKASEAGAPATKVVAKLIAWEEAPDNKHVALSSELSSSLAVEAAVGGIIRLAAAPPQLHRSAVKTLKIYPFTPEGTTKRKDGLKLGADAPAFREALAERIKTIYGGSGPDTRLLSGPLVDGMVLPKADNLTVAAFDGGIIRFDPPLKSGTDSSKIPFGWILGAEARPNIEVQADTARPIEQGGSGSSPSDDPIPTAIPEMVGIDAIITQSMANLTKSSSILIAGGLGAGKTSLSHLLAYNLRQGYLFNVKYFSCRKLVTDETRISNIKDTLNRLFMSASWGARLGGRSLVILDDLDKLCAAETELQVGGDNGRSRQTSEVVCSIVREYCSLNSPVALLATAQSKESLNSVVVGGHVVRDIMSLRAPNKEGRRMVLEKLTSGDRRAATLESGGRGGRARNVSGSTHDSWLDPSNPESRASSAENDGFILARDLDFLEIAGKTDGYMPGDLVLLVARARNEALIRAVQEGSDSSGVATSAKAIMLGAEDFERALKGFTPASLRNITLTSSSTTFSTIGGLHSTRQTLLETLQYPTKYAPIFAQCPLRLRSGLLLYGYPGCGKTLLASAVAGECGLNFISVKGPEILNKYIGASEKSVRDLFERAQAARPCILFFDEFDSIAPKRGHDSTGVTDRVVNQLLTQMDGAEGLSGVYVLAATSRPDLIDPALLRPGRLDKSLLCGMPSHTDRLDIIRAVSEKLKLSDDAESRLDEVAARTDGFSGADLQAVVYNAHLEAVHDALEEDYPETAASGKTRGGGGSRPSVAASGPPANGAPAGDGSSGGNKASSKSFIQFLYSSAAQDAGSVTIPPPAVVAAKLEAVRNSRRRQHELQQYGASAGSTSDADGKSSMNCTGEGSPSQGEPRDEILIYWKHFERSLDSTRRSLSEPERRRFAAIYREFVFGRNGEMPNGEAGTEIGGRTSLM